MVWVPVIVPKTLYSDELQGIQQATRRNELMISQ